MEHRSAGNATDRCPPTHDTQTLIGLCNLNGTFQVLCTVLSINYSTKDILNFILTLCCKKRYGIQELLHRNWCINGVCRMCKYYASAQKFICLHNSQHLQQRSSFPPSCRIKDTSFPFYGPRRMLPAHVDSLSDSHSMSPGQIMAQRNA